jgi:hypothetical protein
MDYSLNVDPSLTKFTPTSSSLEYFSKHDFDLSTNIPAMRTIEPRQLTDMSDSPSSSESTYSSESSPPPRRSKKCKSEHGGSQQSGEGHVKRHQTKLACTWCRKLSKKCDAQRPCGRCIQFDRCSECVDAAPRKARVKGVDRGTYKKTRDLAVVNYQEAVTRREAYVAKMEKRGRRLDVGLTAEQIDEAARKDQVEFMEEDIRNLGDMIEDMEPKVGNIIQGGSPFAGPLEDLFTCSAFPEEDALSQSPSSLVLSPEPETQVSVPSSPTESLFEVSSPRESIASATDYDESDLALFKYDDSDLALCKWYYMDQYPNIQKLITSRQDTEQYQSIEPEYWPHETEQHTAEREDWRLWSESIMVF